MIERLYQLNPPEMTAWDKSGSFTLSRRSYNIGAMHEAIALLINGTVPNYNIRLNYRIEMPVKRIRELWKLHSRRLEREGIVARVAMEVTKNQWRTRPVNRPHYHIACCDDRKPSELIKLVKDICLKEMPKGAFMVTHKRIVDWSVAVWYFVKYRKRNNYLFRTGLGLQKFYTISRKSWWTYNDGTPRTKASIIDEMVDFNNRKHRLTRLEKFIPVKRRVAEWEFPIKQDILKGILDNETDEVLYDWFSILLGKPTIFQTEPPKWLLDNLQSQPLKIYDLLNILYARISQSTNPDIIFCIRYYHGYNKWGKEQQ